MMKLLNERADNFELGNYLQKNKPQIVITLTTKKYYNFIYRL